MSSQGPESRSHTSTTLLLTAFVLLLSFSASGLLAQEDNPQRRAESARPFAVMTVGEDGSVTLEPYDPGTPPADAGEGEVRSVDPVADAEPTPAGGAAVHSVDPLSDSDAAADDEVRLQSLDPVVDEEPASPFGVMVWGVGSQPEPESGSGEVRALSVDPITEPGSPSPGEVTLRSVDPMAESSAPEGPGEEPADQPAGEKSTPDLRISAISGFCNGDGTLAVSGTVQNIGTAAAGPFEVGVYASTNSIISTGDTRIAFADYTAGLSAGSSSTFSGDVTVSISPGTYYIGAYADDRFEVSESDESNNTLAGNQESLPCTGPSFPDLRITSISGFCNGDGTLAVAGTVQNAGSGSAGAFRVGVYASTNSTISTGDTLIAIANYTSGLGAGGSGNFSGDVDVSSVSPGTYYIGAYADDQFQVAESNESNNTLAGNQESLPCPGPPSVDLSISAISGSCNGDGTLAIAGTVRNTGSGSSGAFRVGIYASTNSTISTGDTLIAIANYTSGLGGGSSSNFSGDVDTSSVSPGTYYIGAYADDQFQVSETNESNNSLAGNQEGLPCPTAPTVDLTISAISGSCNGDGTLAVAGTVQNLGGDAAGPFRVGVYASTNSTISTGDTLIAISNYTGGLGGGSSSSFSGDVDVSSVTPGTYYIGAYADDQFQVAETNENNNALAGNQEGLPCPTPAVVDLAISAISGTCNSDGTLAVAGTVQNLGPDAAGPFRVGVYLSTNSTISTGDTLIGIANYPSGLGGSSSSNFSGDVDVSSVTQGTYYIGAYADDQFQVTETDESNNSLAGNQLALPSACVPADIIDLSIASIGGTCNSDGTLAVAGTVQNLGPDAAGPFRVGVYASTNSTISTGDTLIAIANYTGGLGGVSSSNFSGDVDVSGINPPGLYYIGAYADDLFEVAETDEGNNALAGNQEDLPCSGTVGPDIRIDPLTLTFTNPGANVFGEGHPVPRKSARVTVQMSSADLAAAVRELPVGGTLVIEEVPLEWGSPDSVLELERFEVFARDARIVVHSTRGEEVLPAPGNAYFRGFVQGDPQSAAFLTVRAQGGARGVVASGGRYWVLGGGAEAQGPAVGLAIREVDAETEFAAYSSTFECGVDDLPEPLDFLGAVLGRSPKSPAKVASTYTARVAIETDWEFYQLFGNATDAADYVGDLIGFSSGVYGGEVDTDLVVAHVSLWASSNDPWNETSTRCGLYEFGRYWNDNHGDVDRTIAHFLSGKASGGGIAWIGVLCDGQFTVNHQGSCPNLTPQIDNYGGAYGLSGSLAGDFNIANPGVVWDIVVSSHEIGHNFNSPHTHCYAGIGGNANPVDECWAGECGANGCFCGSPTLPCANPGAGCGTIMSYCHQLTGGLGNISLTFGTGHPFGIAPERVPSRMNDHVVATAASDPSCLAGGGGGAGDQFVIFNDGDAVLTVTSMGLETPGPWISWSPQAPFTVPPGGSQAVTVAVDFDLAPQGQSTRRILVESDDSDESPYPGGVFVVVDNGVPQTCYPLSRTHTGSGADPVPSPASSPGCASFEYHAGASIQVTASPASGWNVGSWSGTDNDASTATTNTVTMPASSHTVAVHYVEEPPPPTCYPLSRTHTGSGADPVPTPASSPGCASFEYHADASIQVMASPASGWTVGSWTGTDNDASTAATNTVTMPASSHTVTVHYVEGGGSCGATRTLPAGYVPGQPTPVVIDVDPAPTVQVYAVEDMPPAGWTVSDIDNNGTFDTNTQTVKWGPFFDNQPRSLHYSATPPTGTTGSWSFTGTLSLDGVSEPICGDSLLDPATFHPADMSDNWRMEIDEVTAYGAAWKTGTPWPRPPNPIPIDYVTNAGFLWKVGEVYHFDPTQDPPWVPGAAAQGNGGPHRGQGKGLGTAVSSFDPAEYTPGVGVEVTIAVTPDGSTQVYAVEDGPPGGWTVSGISDSGTFDAVNGLVKWGPFFDNQPRNLIYTATPPAGETGPRTFAGQASFDGSSVPITGDRTISQACTYSIDPTSQSFGSGGGSGVVAVTAPPGCGWTAQSNDAWLSITSGSSGSGDGTVSYTVAANPSSVPRSGTLTIAGETFTVNQEGVSCSYSIDPTSAQAPAAGGTGAVDVTAVADCPWTAQSNDAWLSITSGSSGSGDGTVTYAVAANPSGASRNGTLTIAGETFTVVQDGLECFALTLGHSGSGSDPAASPPSSPGCPTGEYFAGALVGLTASPDPGWTVGGWSGTDDDASTSTTNTVTMPAAAHSVTVIYVQDQALILLVDDDDNEPDVRSFYADALAASGEAFDVWDTGNSDSEPDAATLADYKVVVWFTGDEFGGFAGPSAASEAALGAFLDGGGCLFLSSQDYLWDRGGSGDDILTPFMIDYLGVGVGISDVAQTTVTGTGSVFGGFGTFPLAFPVSNFSDVISPGGAELAFSGDQGDAAVNRDDGVYRSTFWGFPFEALPTAADRAEAMRRILNWCAHVFFADGFESGDTSAWNSTVGQ